MRRGLLELVDIFDDGGFRNSNALLFSGLHESISGKHHREAFRRTERALDEFANRSPCIASLLSAVQIVQVPGCEVITGNNEIRIRRDNRALERQQWRKPVVSMSVELGISFADRMACRTNNFDCASRVR